MQNFNNKVARSFDRAAKAYNKYATMQYQIAQQLCSMIQASKHTEILDIGCGVGYIGAILPNKITQLDIAFKMCQIAQVNNNSLTINANMERLPLHHCFFDVVTASMSLHWSQNLKHTIREIYQILANGGQLYFAIPVANTFYELNHILQLLDLPKIYFYPVNEVISLLQNNNLTVTYKKDRMIIYYPSFASFIKFMKNTGSAITKNEPFLTKQTFYKITSLYKKMFASNDQIQVSWDIAYITAIK